MKLSSIFAILALCLILPLTLSAQEANPIKLPAPQTSAAPLNLIFVADLTKLKGPDADFYAAADTGFISENVYLFCASAGLGTVVRGWVDREPLSRAMKLRPDQKIILAQTVGYPKE